ncbi:ribosomal protection-like ABC-F family protein [Bacillus sp. FJAT-52991]|uniref:ABC-F type ribosomal protection protein n=1 Tax=Bacillus kandeliae TaxID=3129297 RepID=A0ABZ2N854_9BACI
MFILKIENAKMEFDGVTLFEQASLEIQENERVALIGENGVGKTTFLKGILGQIPMKEGKITFGISRDEIGWMMQDSDGDVCLSTREWVESEHLELSQLKRELLKSQEEKRLDDYNQTLQKYLDMDGYQWEVQVEKTLNQLGLLEPVWELPFSSLSGGQKTRAKLARVMIKSPKLLILDEPTNHLDTETIEWLQDWLSRYRGSVLFISHERDFIDQMAQMTYELTEKGMKKYQGGYQAYKTQKDHEMKSLQSLYEKQRQERKKLIDTIQMYKNWYQQANAAASVRNPVAQKQAAKQATKYKTKEKELERLENERVEKPQETPSIQASFDAKDFSGKRMLDVNQVSFSYGTHLVLREVNMQIKRGDRLAVIGKNGSGKTTLLKLMAGKLMPTSGVITRNPQLNIGYFFQELENLHPERTILEELLSLPNITQSEARTILACFLFRKEEVYKKVKQLSMGEKCRVAFVKLYFSGANLLILDEPTNYLDIATRERIEEMLVAYQGAVVVVAHDPYLLRKITNKVAMIGNGKVSNYIGTYEEWEQHVSISPQSQEIRNKQQRLEWELAELLSEEGVEAEEQRLEKAKELKQQLEQLKSMEE